MAKKKNTGTKLLIAGGVVVGGILLYKFLKPSTAVTATTTTTTAAKPATSSNPLSAIPSIISSLSSLFKGSGTGSAGSSGSGGASTSFDPSAYGITAGDGSSTTSPANPDLATWGIMAGRRGIR